MQNDGHEFPPVTPVLRWVVAVAFFMQMLDATILNTALPAIAKDLKVDPLSMQSVIIAYMLTTALLMPASGWLADRFGIRKLFILSVGLFSLGSLFCALAQSLGTLAGARVIQGIGGAIMVPVGRLAIMRAYPRQQLIRILSFITVPGLVGPLVGPMAGGFLVQYASWHWIFLINIPAGLLGMWLALRSMPEITTEKPRRFDGLGFFLFGGAMVVITFAMEGLGELHLPKIQVTLLCVAGLMLLALYWLRASHSDHPLFDLHIFQVRSFTTGILGNLFARLGSTGMPFLFPLFLQLGLGFPPFHAGLTMIPAALAGIMGKNLITTLVERYGFRKFLTLNTLMVGALIASFSSVTAETPYILLLIHLGVFGIFNAMQFTAMNSVTLIDLDKSNAGSGNSLLSVTMQVAATCGVALAAALLNGFSSAYPSLPGAHSIVLQVFSWSFVCMGGCTAASALIFTQVPKNVGVNADKEEE